ncbi:MAG: lipase maturation factor family protein [Verrucomicrobiales bacterium]|nr:lipase maturation factor family protein [Verrucomicrobiales bacterium]MCP5527276.1 lipase maturation factor family protein [Verrucomicrobiales bacterium]
MDEPPPQVPDPKPVSPRTFFISRWWFLRALGLIYLLAFLSLAPQIDGLLGGDGLLPAARHLRFLRAHAGWEAVYAAPSLLWLRPDTTFLHALCGAGIGASLLLLIGAAPRLAALLCWALYLSMVSVGGEFFAYQWDGLLLETGLVAVFLAPGGLWPGRYRGAPSAWTFVWLGRLVLVKLMLGSALGKLLGGDRTWPGLTALQHHFETQPLPTLPAWWMHQLPAWALQTGAGLLLLIELSAPLLIFGPRRVPALAAIGFGVWFILISITGNHAFLNLLAVALCLLLVDDASWHALRGRPPDYDRAAEAMARAKPVWRVALHGMVGATMALLSLFAALDKVLPVTWMAGPPRMLVRAAGPLRSFNAYGMFTRMTPVRQEIIIEGSLDGERWTPYEFRWKPGDPGRAPGFVAPFQPRLDWQMWFEAASPLGTSRWFDRLLTRLLEGDRTTLRLLEADPFPLWPPRYIRAVLYEYHFTSEAERRKDGHWWRREKVRVLVPARALPPEDRPDRLPRGVLRA